jgi:hypothetical protein
MATVLVAALSFLLFSFFFDYLCLHLFYCAVASLAVDVVVMTLVWFPATGMIFHITPELGMVGPPGGGSSRLPQSAIYKAVPFWLNSTPVGLKVVLLASLGFFKVRKSEIENYMFKVFSSSFTKMS